MVVFSKFNSESTVFNEQHALKYMQNPAASIWFEIWGSWIRVKKIRFLKVNFRKISIFVKQFHKKIQFSQANFGFFRKFHKKFDFSRQISKKPQFFRQFKKNLDFQAKFAHLQLLPGKLLYFSSKVTTIEHTSCT